MFERTKDYLFRNTTSKQIIIKNTFWLFLAEGINKGLMFVLTIIIANYLGVNDYGKFSFAFAFVALFSIFSDFGLSTILVRDVTRDKSLLRKYSTNVSFLKIFLGVITFFLIFGVTQFIDKTYEIRFLIYLAGVYVIINTFNDFLRSFFRVFEEMQYEALSKIVNGVTLLLFVGSFMFFKFPLVYLVLGYAVSSVLNLIFTIVLVSKNAGFSKSEFSFVFIKELLKEVWPLAISLYFIGLYMFIDQVFLGFLKSDYEVGIYSFAYKFIMLVAIFSYVLMNSVLPRITKENVKIDYYFANIKYIFLYSLIVNIGTLLLSIIFIRLFFTNFLESIHVLAILIFASFFEFFVYWGYLFLLKLGKKFVILKFTAISAIINILLNILLIPSISVFGAAIATVTSYIIHAIAIYTYLRRERRGERAAYRWYKDHN